MSSPSQLPFPCRCLRPLWDGHSVWPMGLGTGAEAEGGRRAGSKVSGSAMQQLPVIHQRIIVSFCLSFPLERRWWYFPSPSLGSELPIPRTYTVPVAWGRGIAVGYPPTGSRDENGGAAISTNPFPSRRFLPPIPCPQINPARLNPAGCACPPAAAAGGGGEAWPHPARTAGGKRAVAPLSSEQSICQARSP